MDISVITTRQHPTLENKATILQLLNDSYSGGQTYRDGNYLHKFSLRESDAGYEERKKRAVHLNNVQPLVDMFAGFLFTELPTRKNALEYLIDNAGNFKKLNDFMYDLSASSLMYTTGVLIESPKFSTDVIITEADRKNAGINPYCVKYDPTKIRDYYPDYGPLEWVLLDNSYMDSSDPFVEPVKYLKYTLWTSEYFQDFIKSDGTGDDFAEGEEMPHPVGEVPFIFVNWRNNNLSRIADTIFEDIAFFDQAIYNAMSLMDEMVHGGTFKHLFYPSLTGELPSEIKEGFANNATLPFDSNAGTPFFAGPTLEDTAPFLQVMDFHITAIKRKLGLDTDMEKIGTQSGVAKAFDFKKTKSLLKSGSQAMEYAEKEIFRIAGLWESSTVESDVVYYNDFLGEEMSTKLTRLYALLTLGSIELDKVAKKQIVNLNLKDEIEPAELKKVILDLEKEPVELDINDLTAQEQKTKNKVATNGSIRKSGK